MAVADRAALSSTPSDSFPLLSCSFDVRQRLLRNVSYLIKRNSFKIDYRTASQLEETCRTISKSCQRLEPVFYVDECEIDYKVYCYIFNIIFDVQGFRYNEQRKCSLERCSLTKEERISCRVYAKEVEISVSF